MRKSELAQRDREAREAWKKSFLRAWEALGGEVAGERRALEELSHARAAYLAAHKRAAAAGVAYDPRKERAA